MQTSIILTPTTSTQPIQGLSSGQQKGGKPHTQGRIYALTQQDAQASNIVVSGILLLSSVYAHVLFDSGATHSFVSSIFVQKHNIPYAPLGV